MPFCSGAISIKLRYITGLVGLTGQALHVQACYPAGQAQLLSRVERALMLWGSKPLN